jgi:aspartyl-tRNA(Asn)/glutamyl-tRNA(Gln) amidotransferase subunit C
LKPAAGGPLDCECHFVNNARIKLQTIIFVDMEVTDEMIENLAGLARLHFSEEEKREIRSDLQRMIAFIDKLNELNTDNVQPVLHMSDGSNVFREDEVHGSVTREEALKNAPASDGVFFKVPKVIKKVSE